MEIKPVPKIIEDIGKMVQEEKYEEACSFGLENIDLNKKYIEGEYAFKNILEEYIFQFFKKGEIKRKYPLMLDYSSLYADYGIALFKMSRFEEALKSLDLALKYNPVNVKALLILAEIERDRNPGEYLKISIDCSRYSYSLENLAKSLRNISDYYLNKKEKYSAEDMKTACALFILSREYDSESKTAISELGDLEEKLDLDSILEFKEDDGYDISKIKEYLKSRNLPHEASIEIITICKTLGFQLDEAKKVVPALFYFNIAYDLSKDPAIKETIDILNEKIERKEKE